MCAASCLYRENIRAGADVCSRVAPGTPEVPSAGIGTAPPAAAAGLCTPASRRRVPARAKGTEYQWIGRKAIANEDDRPPQLQKTTLEKACRAATASVVGRSREIVQRESLDIRPDHRGLLLPWPEMSTQVSVNLQNQLSDVKNFLREICCLA